MLVHLSMFTADFTKNFPNITRMYLVHRLGSPAQVRQKMSPWLLLEHFFTHFFHFKKARNV